ncbi:hypothetical protein KDN24_06535 [Bacillus sp. Bva_UNVM-123]|uniref:hypothetical protein n=1 Tax=Bacillus sp. Bva_UNVM-123 TaxID=2829798 RepID=UPI00391F94C3
MSKYLYNFNHDALKVELYLLDDIYADGSYALDDITESFLEAREFNQIEREQELLSEIRNEEKEYRKRLIDKLYKLLETDKLFNSMSSKEGRTMRATELAASIGLHETKTNIVSYIEIFTAKMKLNGKFQ